MSTALTGTLRSATYSDLLQLGNSGSGITSSLLQICDGLGNQSSLFLSTLATNVTGNFSVTNQVTTNVGIVSTNVASQTAANFTACNSSGTPYVTIGPDTLSGTSTISNFLNVTGTLPATITAGTYGINVLITSAGSSSFAQRAINVSLSAGYTGSASTYALLFANSAAGTGTSSWTNGGGNYGVSGIVSGTTAGNNTAITGTAQSSSTQNLGVLGRAVSSTNSPALNIAVGGIALSATVNVAGYFGLTASAPTLGTSAALIADCGATSSAIMLLRANGTVVSTHDKFGNITWQPTQQTSGAGTTSTWTGQAAQSSGNVNGGGLTFAGGAGNGTGQYGVINLNSAVSVAPTAASGTANASFSLTTPAHTALTASTEFSTFATVTATQQFATGALTTNRYAVFAAPTYSAVGATTITNAATLAITGAPIAGTNVTLTNTWSLWCQNGVARFDGGITNNGPLLFATDGTYSIGAVGATRPYNIYMSGTLFGGGSQWTAASYFSEVTITQSAGSATWNWATQQVADITLTASITSLTISNLSAGQVSILRIVQGGSGSYTITWPGSFYWPGGTAPTLSTSVGAIDIITAYSDGTKIYAIPQINFQT